MYDYRVDPWTTIVLNVQIHFFQIGFLINVLEVVWIFATYLKKKLADELCSLEILKIIKKNLVCHECIKYI